MCVFEAFDEAAGAHVPRMQGSGRRNLLLRDTSRGDGSGNRVPDFRNLGLGIAKLRDMIP